ncbi:MULTISPECIES: Arc family DNA-binding protein [Serratia]|uniref:Arc family DNA-binding protein n=1 Tax=Serratia TaxID=613 RepID=UPI00092FE3D6|nr:hypothetical protein BVG84_10970 [Serratia marcescens]
MYLWWVMKEQKQVNPYPVRMPAEVKDWMSIQAKAAGRSLNSEIVRVLTERMNRSIGRAKSA